MIIVNHCRKLLILVLFCVPILGFPVLKDLVVIKNGGHRSTGEATFGKGSVFKLGLPWDNPSSSGGENSVKADDLMEMEVIPIEIKADGDQTAVTDNKALVDYFDAMAARGYQLDKDNNSPDEWTELKPGDSGAASGSSGYQDDKDANLRGVIPPGDDGLVEDNVKNKTDILADDYQMDNATQKWEVKVKPMDSGAACGNATRGFVAVALALTVVIYLLMFSIQANFLNA